MSESEALCLSPLSEIGEGKLEQGLMDNFREAERLWSIRGKGRPLIVPVDIEQLTIEWGLPQQLREIGGMPNPGDGVS